jgi:hypothetical protein
MSGYVAEVSSSEAGATGGEFPGHMTFEVYFVQITNPQGRRFQHERRFPSATVYSCEVDGWTKLAPLPGALQAAQRLAERVNQALATGRRLDRASWREVDPAYGSEEYVAQGIEHDRRAAERLAG